MSKTPRERAEDLAARIVVRIVADPLFPDSIKRSLIEDLLIPIFEEINVAMELAESHSHLMRWAQWQGVMIAGEKWEIQKRYDAIQKRNSEDK